MFGIFKDHFKKKRKEAHELELKKALSERFFNYDESSSSKPEDASDKTDYIEITIFGKKVRAKKEHITILDIPTYG